MPTKPLGYRRLLLIILRICPVFVLHSVLSAGVVRLVYHEIVLSHGIAMNLVIEHYELDVHIRFGL